MKNCSPSPKAATAAISKIDKLALSISEVSEVTGLSRTYLYEEVRAGRLATRKAGSRTLVLRKNLDDFLANLPVVNAKPDAAA